MTLTNENKARHAKGIRNSLRTLLNRNMLPKVRIGSSVTADGAVFELTNPRYTGKVLFYNTPKDYSQIEKEFKIGKMMGELGIGPKVYSIQKLQFMNSRLPNNLLENENMLGPNAAMIVMENLAYKAKKLESLWDYVERVGTYPTRQVGGLYKKLVMKRLIHGDLHANNIMVKTLPSGRIRLYLIDFTRTIELAPGKTAANYFKGQKPLDGYPGYYEIGSNIVANNAAILNRNFKRLNKPSNMIKVHSVSVPRSLFKTPEKQMIPNFRFPMNTIPKSYLNNKWRSYKSLLLNNKTKTYESGEPYAGMNKKSVILFSNGRNNFTDPFYINKNTGKRIYTKHKTLLNFVENQKGLDENNAFWNVRKNGHTYKNYLIRAGLRTANLNSPKKNNANFFKGLKC